MMWSLYINSIQCLFMGWLTSVSGVSSSCGISMAYIFMAKISESLVAEGLFFNKKWVRWSALILINQLWQMVILPFKRGLEKLNSRWFKNSLRAAEPNLKKEQKAEQNTLKLSLFGVPEGGEPAPFPGIQGDIPTQVEHPGCHGTGQEMCLVMQTSFNPNNVIYYCLRKSGYSSFGVGGGNYYTFHREFAPDILPNLCCLILKDVCGAWVDEGWLRHSHCDSQSINWYWDLKGSQFAGVKPALLTWFQCSVHEQQQPALHWTAPS